jgi:hypothetical protein
MNEFPSIDIMIRQLNNSITKIEATTLSKENYVLQTLKLSLQLALDIKLEEFDYFKSKNNNEEEPTQDEKQLDEQTENQIEEEQINKHLN